MTQSSYLIDFIKCLDNSSSKEIREKNKQQLEADYKNTSAVLDKCLSGKIDEVNKVLKIYHSVSQKMSDNQTGVHKMKRDLLECKSLLHCNREELRRLWLELVEQRWCLDFVNDLDKLRSIPDAIRTLVAANALFEATHLVSYASHLSLSEIGVVPALQSVRSELDQKHKNLVGILKKNVYRLLYENSLNAALDKQLMKSADRQVKPKLTSKEFAASNSAGVLSHFYVLPLHTWHTCVVSAPVVDPQLRENPQAAAAAIVQNVASSRTTQGSKNDNLDVLLPSSKNDRAVVLSETEWIQGLLTNIHCLIHLDKVANFFGSNNCISKLLEAWRPQSLPSTLQYSTSGSSAFAFTAPPTVGRGLVGEIHRSIVLKAVSIIEARAAKRGDSVPLSDVSTTRHLVKLLKLIFNALIMQSRACLLVIRAINSADRTTAQHFKTVEGLTNNYIWTCIQCEVQLILSTHLSPPSTTKAVDPADPDNDNSVYSMVTPTVNSTRSNLSSLIGSRGTATFSLRSPSTGAVAAIGAALSKSSPAVDGGASGGSSSNSLFSFNNTSHSLAVSSYIRIAGLPPASDFDLSAGDESTSAACPRMCRPSRDNLIYVYDVVMKFTDAVEYEMSIAHEAEQSTNIYSPQSSSTCQLRKYITNFVEKSYLPELRANYRRKLQEDLNAPDALTTTVPQKIERQLGLYRPILSVFYAVDQYLLEIKHIASLLPEYVNDCMQISIDILNEFISSIGHFYRSFGTASSGSILASYEWSRDEDLSRIWKNFPVWDRMAKQDARYVASVVLSQPVQPPDGAPARTRTSSSISSDDSDADKGGQGHLKEQSLLSSSRQAFSESVNDNYVSVATAVVLGLHSDYTNAGDGASYNRLVIPFANGHQEALDSVNQTGRSTQLQRLLHQREANKLALKETEQVIHMLQDELAGSDWSNKNGEQLAQELPVIKGVQVIKMLGLLSESLWWLSHKVSTLSIWPPKPRATLTGRGLLDPTVTSSLTPRRKAPLKTPLTTCTEQLTRLSEACLLMIYFEVRIRAYNCFGARPRKDNYWCIVDDVDVDDFVLDFLAYRDEVEKVLVNTCSRHKFKFVFDGLDNFIAQLLLKLMSRISRMNANGNRKMCRNIYRLERSLAAVTERNEYDLIHVKHVYELFNLTPEVGVNRLIEQGVTFDENVYKELFHLYKRSHPSLDHSVIEKCLAKLSNFMRTAS